MRLPKKILLFHVLALEFPAITLRERRGADRAGGGADDGAEDRGE